MNVEQIETLTRAIKGTYPKFSLNREQYLVWASRLKNYDFEDVEKNFNNYVLSGNKETVTIVDLINNLKTKEQKKPIAGIYRCSRCGTAFENLLLAEECEERDSSIKYILKMSKKMGIDYKKYFGELEKCSLKDINKNYDNFILRIIEEQKKEPRLRNDELIGLRGYYKNVILKGGLLVSKEQ